MADFNFVTDRIATGGAISSSQDAQQLIDAGITHIIDCRAEEDDANLLKTSPQIVGYIYLGVPDDGQPKPASWFQQGIEFALEALAQPHHKVYAHCAAGVNRGPSMCYALLRATGLDPADAENQIRKNRPQVGLAYKHDADLAIASLGYE